MEDRISKIKKEMESREIDLIILFSSRNIYYVSDTAQFSICVLPLDGKPFIFIKRNFQRGKQETWIKDVIKLESTKGVIQEIQDRKLEIKNLGLELNFLRAMHLSQLPQEEYQ